MSFAFLSSLITIYPAYVAFWKWIYREYLDPEERALERGEMISRMTFLSLFARIFKIILYKRHLD